MALLFHTQFVCSFILSFATFRFVRFVSFGSFGSLVRSCIHSLVSSYSGSIVFVSVLSAAAATAAASAVGFANTVLLHVADQVAVVLGTLTRRFYSLGETRKLFQLHLYKLNVLAMSHSLVGLHFPNSVAIQLLLDC